MSKYLSRHRNRVPPIPKKFVSRKLVVFVKLMISSTKNLSPLHGSEFKFSRYRKGKKGKTVVEIAKPNSLKFSKKDSTKKSFRKNFPSFEVSGKGERFVFGLSTTKEKNNVEISKEFFKANSKSHFLPSVGEYMIFPRIKGLHGIEFVVSITLEPRSKVKIVRGKEIEGNIYNGFCIITEKNTLLPHDYEGEQHFPNYKYKGSFNAGMRDSFDDKRRPILLNEDNSSIIQSIQVRFHKNSPDSNDWARILFNNSKDFYEGQIGMKKGIKDFKNQTKLDKLKPQGFGYWFTSVEKIVHFGTFKGGKREGCGICYDIETGDRYLCRWKNGQSVKSIKKVRGIKIWHYLINDFVKGVQKQVTSSSSSSSSRGGGGGRSNKKIDDIYEILVSEKNGFVGNIITLFCKYIEFIYGKMKDRGFLPNQEKRKNNNPANLSSLKTDLRQFVEELRSMLIRCVPRGGSDNIVEMILINKIFENCGGLIYRYYQHEYRSKEEELKRKIKSFRTFMSNSDSSHEQKVKIINEVIKDGLYYKIVDDSSNNDNDDLDVDKRILRGMDLISSIYPTLGQNNNILMKKTDISKLFKRYTKILKRTFFNERIQALTVHPQFRKLVEGGDVMLKKLLYYRIPMNETIDRTWLVKKTRTMNILSNDFLLIQSHSKIRVLGEILRKENFRYLLNDDCHIMKYTKLGDALYHLMTGFQFIRHFMNHPKIINQKQQQQQKSSSTITITLTPHSFEFRDIFSNEEYLIYDCFSRNIVLLFTKIHDDDRRDSINMFNCLKSILQTTHESIFHGFSISLSNLSSSSSSSSDIIEQEEKENLQKEIFSILESTKNLLDDQYRQKTIEILENIKKLRKTVERIRKIGDEMISNRRHQRIILIEEEQEKKNEIFLILQDQDALNAILKFIDSKLKIFKMIIQNIGLIVHNKKTPGVSSSLMKPLFFEFLAQKFFIKFQRYKRRRKKKKNPKLKMLVNELCTFLSSFISVIYRYTKSSEIYFSKSLSERRCEELRRDVVDDEDNEIIKYSKDQYQKFLRMREKVKSFSCLIKEFKNFVTLKKNVEEEEEEEEEEKRSDEKYESLSTTFSRILSIETDSIIKNTLTKLNKIKKEEIEGEEEEDNNIIIINDEKDRNEINKKIDLLKEFSEKITNCFEFYRIFPFLALLRNYQSMIISLLEFVDIKEQYTSINNNNNNIKLSSNKFNFTFKKEIEVILKNKMIKKIKSFMFSTLKWSMMSLQKLECRKVFFDFFFLENLISLESLGIEKKFIPKPSELLDLSCLNNNNKKNKKNQLFLIKSFYPYQKAIDQISKISDVRSFKEKIEVLVITDHLMKDEMKRISKDKKLLYYEDEGKYLSLMIFVFLFCSDRVNHCTDLTFLEDWGNHDESYQQLLTRYRIFLNIVRRFVPNEVDALLVQLELENKKRDLLRKLQEMGYQSSSSCKNNNNSFNDDDVKKEEEEDNNNNFLDPNRDSVSLHWLDRLLDHIYCNVSRLSDSDEDNSYLMIEMKGIQYENNNNDDDDQNQFTHLFSGDRSLTLDNLGMSLRMNSTEKEQNNQNQNNQRKRTTKRRTNNNNNNKRRKKLYWMEYVRVYIDRCNEILLTLGISVLYIPKDHGYLKIKVDQRFSARVYDVIRDMLWKEFRKYILSTTTTTTKHHDHHHQITVITELEKKKKKKRMIEKYREFKQQSPVLMNTLRKKKMEMMEEMRLHGGADNNIDDIFSKDDDDDDDEEEEEEEGEGEGMDSEDELLNLRSPVWTDRVI